MATDGVREVWAVQLQGASELVAEAGDDALDLPTRLAHAATAAALVSVLNGKLAAYLKDLSDQADQGP